MRSLNLFLVIFVVAAMQPSEHVFGFAHPCVWKANLPYILLNGLGISARLEEGISCCPII
jgi:hypothetical protein